MTSNRVLPLVEVFGRSVSPSRMLSNGSQQATYVVLHHTLAFYRLAEGNSPRLKFSLEAFHCRALSDTDILRFEASPVYLEVSSVDWYPIQTHGNHTFKPGGISTANILRLPSDSQS